MTGKELLQKKEEFDEQQRVLAMERYKKHKADEEGKDPQESPAESSKEEFRAPPHVHGEKLAVYHCNRAACLLHLERFEEALVDCQVAVLLNPTYTKAWMRRSTAHEKTDRIEEALQDAKKALQTNPGNANLRKTVDRLQKLEDERLEKLKEETMGKLKDLGNTILGNFGLSLDNFQAVQDPNTGSYSISFNQDPKAAV
eukprot:CAMPEP_0116838276 /NCGR_PEP_ID=MMETSP0418-20121206/9121_1 /TAXON_ID=1158023 /ORGANISM="Astrosyne radiata, Strain 13vi08-1A" /LENGTH=198 /DNA_ID=CAMNT_0004468257 /DNA_START=24 /DNA_END=621 /DNA_ORIENTATION=-